MADQLRQEKLAPRQETSSLAESLALLPKLQQKMVLKRINDRQAEELIWDWKFWARPKQIPPHDDWLIWLILTGRGWGKTRCGAETVRAWACGNTPLSGGKFSRIALVAETAADARDVLVEGESGLLAIHPQDFRPEYEPSKRRLTWPNGAVATLYNATEPDQLRGPQFDAAWCDELAKWQYVRETWDMLQFGLRLGKRPQQIITTTPRPIQVLKEIIASQDTMVTRGSTYENKGNLAPSFLDRIIDRYQGTRLGRQELEAEILDDNPNALWTRAMIEAALVKDCPQLARIVVAIDPSGTSGKDDEAGDDIGIVAAGLGIDGNCYILADGTCNESPAGWGRAAVDLYTKYDADRIVGERNFGGAMVEHVIRTVNPMISYKEVTASRGKWVRAEPIAALYEQGRVKHVGGFPKMEDEMCTFGVDGLSNGRSPNRLDALVWAVTELALQGGALMFAASELDIVVDGRKIPGYWQQAFAFDLDHERFAAIWAARDIQTDVVYLFDEYRVMRTELAVHKEALVKRGKWIPGLFDLKGRGRSKEESIKITDRLSDQLSLFTVDIEQEAAFEEMRARLSTGRLKVFSHLNGWLGEYRQFRRGDDGESAAPGGDHLMKVTAMLLTYIGDVATSEAASAIEVDYDRDRDERKGNRTTGY